MTVEQRKVAREYSKYKAPKKLPSFEEFCYPKSYNVQRQQAFAGEYMAPIHHHNSLLVFHKIGAGKTCLAIQIAERYKGKGKPLIIMPASLIPGFRNELRSKCAGDHYLTQIERNELADLKPQEIEYKKIIQRSDDRIDGAYQIFSYNKFVEVGHRIKAPIIIVDEVQNINNLNGVFFSTILSWIEHNPQAPSIIMSGTPIFDSPKEIIGLAMLMRIDPTNLMMVDDANPNLQKLSPNAADHIGKLFAGKVSYFAGAPAFTFPRAEIKIKKCYMSKYQQRWYKSEVEAESTKQGIKLVPSTNDFYIKSRQRSNIVFPNGLTGEEGMAALKPAMIKTSLDVYSTKYHTLIKRLSNKQLAFVYSGFTEAGGIESLKKCLAAFGWQDYAVAGPGPKRYAVWSGDQTLKQKDIIRTVYNSPANNDASQIQVVIGSPSIKEGVSLMRTREVHVMEAYWNHSRLEQIYGRANRYCSHKTLPKADRTVTIFIYVGVCSVPERGEKDTPATSIDMYMLNLADDKKIQSEPFVEALQNVAVDKLLNK